MPHLFSTTADVERSLQGEQHLLQAAYLGHLWIPTCSVWCTLTSAKHVQHLAGGDTCHETNGQGEGVTQEAASKMLADWLQRIRCWPFQR